MKKWITILSAASLLLASWSMDAQTVTRSKDFSPFENVEVGKYFEVTFENSTTYHVDWEINEDLSQYVDIYVRQNTLIVDLNKEGAKYMKKTYRGNDNVPTMTITVSMPNLKVLTMSENASISSESQPMYSSYFCLNAKDKVKIDNFKMSVENGSIDINLLKDAEVSLQMQADAFNVTADNSAKMALTCSTKKLNVQLAGSSSVGLAGDIDSLNVKTCNYSHLTAQGQGEVLNCESKGVSIVEAEKFEVDHAKVTLNSAVAWVNAVEDIELDLANASELVFCGHPAMQIQGVKKSSITRIENAVKREKK